MRRRKYKFVLLALLLPQWVLLAQQDSTIYSKLLKNSSLEIYGAINYFNFDWQTDTVKRNAIDNEMLVFEFSYQRSKRLRFNTEIEFEHGGTGVGVEFDRFEEFGEFEFDVSKGGEVWVEQMNLEFIAKKWSLQAGRVKVPFSLWFDASKGEPTDYRTAMRSEAEAAILPNNWTENGLAFSSYKLLGTNTLHFYAAFVNGLDNAAFNSANWIKRGNQRRFEMANAENFALAARTDFRFRGNLVGASAYFGNTTGNRPKPDLKVDAPIFLVEGHAALRLGRCYLNALAIYGHLENSEAVTNQNRNLSNNLNVKRTPVGAASLAGFAELGGEFLRHESVLAPGEQSSLVAYLRADYYDTMQDTEGVVFNNPRWERKSISAGLVYQMLHDVHLKFQYSLRKVGAPAPTSVNGGTLERTAVLGLAFDFH
ncbi:MAG: autotransporter outer membrane beta-barrel domain-containing protein [Saprospiraceae bacterium]|nr:autotransporter outer membrane beta-barrel domain-containing protein [Saprospiraceae bacterium]